MGRLWVRRGVGAALALGVASAVVALPARAVNEDLTIFSQFLAIDDSTTIGTGGDGSLVHLTSSFSFLPPEEAITEDMLTANPSLYYNPDLFSWAPGQDQLRQFTATALVENADGDDVEVDTYNDSPAVFTRTGDSRNADGTRVAAVAYRSNADPSPELVGPVTGVDDISDTFEALGGSGSLIVYWDSELAELQPQTGGFLPLTTVAHYQQCHSPAVAFRTRVTNRGGVGTNYRTIEIADSWVAFAGTANNNQDNEDGNDEIHVWTRSEALDSAGEEGFVNNSGIQQLTHTTGGKTCWAPAVNIRGDVAFLSDANITGGNPDGSVELFLFHRKRGDVRQLTSISPSKTIGPPSWGDNGRKIAFASNANLTGGNLDGNSEIHTWKAGKFKQVTKTTTGQSHSPSMDPYGNTIAFLTSATLKGVVYLLPVQEIVATPSKGGAFRQITQSNDGWGHDAPMVTRHRNGKVQVTFVSYSNLDGRNSNHNPRIHRADVK